MQSIFVSCPPTQPIGSEYKYVKSLVKVTEANNCIDKCVNDYYYKFASINN